MRLFNKLLFMGNDSSRELCYVLHERLQRAMSLNSSMQQGYKPTAEEQANLEDTVKDFAAALLGRNITLGKKLDYFAKDTVEVPQSGPPSTSEVDRVMSWASCVDCSGQLTMICPTCARDVLKQAKDAIVEVKEATHKPEKLSRLTFAIGIINGVRFVLRMGHDNSR